MRSLSASLTKIAASAPLPFRKMFATMAKEATLISNDMYARAAFLEGALGASPNSYANNPGRFFDDIREQMEKRDGSLWTHLAHVTQVKDKDLLPFISDKNEGVYLALVSAIASQMKGHQALRGIGPEGIASAVSFGISPITGEWLKKYGNKAGLWYYLGSTVKKPYIAGLIKAAKKAGVQQGHDFVRATTGPEKQMLYHDVALQSDGDETETLLDLIQGDIDPTWTMGFASTLLTSPNVLKVLDDKVAKGLKTPTQQSIWKVLVENPYLLTVSGSKDGKMEVGVKSKELAKKVAEDMGVEYYGKSMDVKIRKTFVEKIRHLMYKSFTSDQAAKEFVRSSDIRKVMYQEIKRRKKPHKLKMKIPLQGLGTTPTRGPKKWIDLDDDTKKELMDQVQEAEEEKQRAIQKKLPRALRQAALRKVLASVGLIRIAGRPRRFSKVDWYGYAGAESFSDGSEPWIVEVDLKDADLKNNFGFLASTTKTVVVNLIADSAGLEMTGYGSKGKEGTSWHKENRRGQDSKSALSELTKTVKMLEAGRFPSGFKKMRG